MPFAALLLSSFITSAAFASDLEIQCIERGSPSHKLQISLDHETRKVTGISIYNTDAGQMAQATFKKAVGHFTYYSFFVSVAFEDHTELLIPGMLLDGKTKGIAHTNDGREFNCN